jgi:sulfonate transport system permease protein
VSWKKIKYHGFVLPFALLIGWWFVTWQGIISESFLPAPGKVFEAFIFLLNSGDLSFNLELSLARVIKGFLLGSSLGFILGTLMGLSRIIEKLVGPFFHAIRQVPLLGWIPIIIIGFGIGEIAKVVFISISAFYPLVLNTFQGIRSVKKEYIEVAQVFEYNKVKLLRKVIFPGAIPSIFTGIRFSLSISWMMVVAAELFTSTAGGIGNMMNEAREQHRIDILMVGIIVIGIVGFVMNKLAGMLENYFLRWKKKLI